MDANCSQAKSMENPFGVMFAEMIIHCLRYLKVMVTLARSQIFICPRSEIHPKPEKEPFYQSQNFLFSRVNPKQCLFFEV